MKRVVNGRARAGVVPLLVAGVLALAVAGCGTTNQSETTYEERPVADLYNSGLDALKSENYKQATKMFDEVERQHPYSPWATKAQLMAAYAHYQANQYDDAVAAIDRFIRVHPANKDVPYALYLKGLCFYEQISDVGRDQKMTQEARKALDALVSRYPDSKYARDAKLKLDLINDHLAGKEMNIGRYYLRQGDYLAAINRFRTVVEQYQTTTHTPEALHRLVEAYMAIGLTEEARKVAAILGHNYPSSEWYIDSYELVENKRIRPPEEPWFKFW